MGVTSTYKSSPIWDFVVDEQYQEIQTTNNQLEFYDEKDVEELYEQNTNE